MCPSETKPLTEKTIEEALKKIAPTGYRPTKLNINHDIYNKLMQSMLKHKQKEEQELRDIINLQDQRAQARALKRRLRRKSKEHTENRITFEWGRR